MEEGGERERAEKIKIQIQIHLQVAVGHDDDGGSVDGPAK